MQIIFIPKGTSEDLMNYTLDQIKSPELEEIKKELWQIDSNYKIQGKNFGTGADWIMILAVFNSLANIFLLGDKINTGIEGWAKIAKRIKNIFSKSTRAYIDIDVAIILGIEYLSKKNKIDSFKVVMQASIPIKDLSTMLLDRDSKDFIAQPYSLYLLTFEVNDRILVTLGIRSDGKIKEHYCFDKEQLPPF